MNQMFDSKFFYRLRFFILGILIGTVVMYVIYWKDNRKVLIMPNTIIKQNIRTYKWKVDSALNCKLNCLKIDTFILKRNLESAEINYFKSEPHLEPCKKYCIEYNHEDKKYSVFYLLCGDSLVCVDGITSDLMCSCPN